MRISTCAFVFLCLGLLMGIPECAQAQDEDLISTSEEGTRLTFDGLFQGRLSYVDLDDGSATGFGVRRMYFRANASLPHNFGVSVQVNARGGAVSTVDAVASYTPSQAWRFRGGSYVVPQPAVAAGPPSRHVDAADRASIGEWWASEFLSGSRRDFGVDAQYREGPLTFNVTLHSGNGDLGNFRPRVWGRSSGTAGRPLAVGSSLIYNSPTLENLQLGVYGGYNPEPPLAQTQTLDDTHTLSAHLYWGELPGSQLVRLKADVIRAQANLAQSNILNQGISLLAAFGPFETAEIFVRGELLNSDLYSPADQTIFLTTGLHYSLSARQGGPFYRHRLTFALSALEEGDGFQYPTAVLQLQLAF